MIDYFQLKQFRLFKELEFKPEKKLNLIEGDNASGKTSILEALYFLSRTKSFRTSKTDQMIQHDESEFSVFAKISSGVNQIPVGIRKSRESLEVRINASPAARSSELSSVFPVQVIHPASNQLILEGPAWRRRFVDWGVFHVEHNFPEIWSSYEKALRQRNAALRERQSKQMVSVWNSELVKYGSKIDELRQGYIESLTQIIPRYLPKILPDLRLGLSYQKGWSAATNLENAIEQNFAKDFDLGYTGVGPHRADLRILADGFVARDKISRGQLKLVVVALYLIQAFLMVEQTQKNCALLLDDLTAELDQEHQNNLAGLLAESSFQLFVTQVQSSPIWNYFSDDKVYYRLQDGTLNRIA